MDYAPIIYLCSVNGQIHIMGAKVIQNESARVRKFPRTLVPGSEWARERIGQGPTGKVF